MAPEEERSLALDQVIRRVRILLEELYGSDGFHTWSDAAFIRVVEQQVVFLVLSGFHDDVVLNVRCYVVRDVERPDEALGHYLACCNSEQLFGGFSIDEDADVCFDYSLLGSAITEDSLHLAIEVVAHAAAGYAPEIIDRWGGVSSLEKLRIQMESQEGGSESDEDEPAN
ncbi:MAG: hypothetical protein GY906_09770 [bacterium]|nr:hypothetical protein [bacterium]